MRARASILLLGSGLGACAAAVGADDEADPLATFDRVWGDFDRYYGMFEVKHVDWDALHEVHSAEVEHDSTDRELYEALTSMLAHLNDKHVTLYPATSPDLPTWSVDLVDGRFVEPAFDRDLVVDGYLSRHRVIDPNVEVGLLTEDLGWVHVSTFDGSPRSLGRAIDDALAWLGDVNGIVLDVRDDPGGFDPAAQAVAGRFADRTRHYMTVRKRNGPDHDDFTAPVEWFVRPEGDRRFTGPVVLLTSYATQSAAETFALAMREVPHVTHMGETTSGAFSDAILRDAPNGWTYAISVGDYRDVDGRSWEGIGLAPDVEVANTYDEIRAGEDRTLEAAIAALAAAP